VRRKVDAGKLIAYVLLIGLSIVFIVPFAWLVTTSVKPDSQILHYPPIWIPHPFNWRNYADGLTAIPFALYLRNTLIICSAVVVGTTLSSSLVAYGLSRIPWKGRDVLFYTLVGTMLLPPQVTMVPVFSIFKNLGWLDTYLPLTFPAFLAGAFNVFLLRQFFRSIPNELTEAARIDGTTEFDNYWRIVLPLAKPALWTVGLFAFIGAWNDYLGPLIYLFDDRKYTLSLGLAMFRNQYGAEWGQMMAVSTVVTVPLVILFFFTQRTFVQGITMTGIKG
jgi:multiple sugar transport system permease protein